jgi:hypothetical protein
MRWAKAVFHGIAPFAALYGALFLMSWWPLIIYPLAIIGISAFELAAFPLHPVTEAVVTHEQRFRRYGLIGIGALFGIALLSNLWR